MAEKGGGVTRGETFGGGFASPFAGIRAFLPATGAYPVIFVDVVSVRGGTLTDLKFRITNLLICMVSSSICVNVPSTALW